MTDSLLLREEIRNSGFKYKHIAKILGISYYSLQRKIENKTEFKPSEIKALCELIRMNNVKQKESIFFK